MATYTWSIPTGQTISGNTYIKDTDDKLQNTLDDLVEFVNGEGSHLAQGLTYDLVDKATAQTITGIKTFSGGIISNVTGDVTGDVTGNAATASEATALGIGADRTKLDGIEAGATADQTGAEIKLAYEAEPDTNAFTDAEKTKLSGIDTGAQVNVQPDWDATTGDAQILNKPSLSPSLVWGEEQTTGYLNSLDAVVDYSVPAGCVMTGLYSYHSNGAEDRQWKIRYRALSVSM